MESADTQKTPTTFVTMLCILGAFCVGICCVFAGFAIKFALDGQPIAAAFLLLKSIAWLLLLRYEFLAIRRRDRQKSQRLAWAWAILAGLFTVLLFVWCVIGRTDYVLGQLLSLIPVTLLAVGHYYWLRELTEPIG